MNAATQALQFTQISPAVQHALLLIDLQNGFMDHDNDLNDELPVAGATDSARRTARFLTTMTAAIGSVVATLDSHAAYGIERPGYWIDEKGSALPPYTLVTKAMIQAGTARAANPDSRSIAEHVIFKLDSVGMSLMIWPRHCVLGTRGHALESHVAEALMAWEVSRLRTAVRVLKGTNPDTEHYSALEAEVDLDTENTSLDMSVPNALTDVRLNGRIFVAGQASSHCVPATLRSLLRVAPELKNRITLLTDCMNPVPGFEAAQQQMFDWIQSVGGELMTAKQAQLAYGIT